MYSVGSIFAHGHVWDSKFPCVTVGHDHMHDPNIKKEVNKTVAEVFAWSLKAASKGLWPSTGPFGEELTGFRKARAGTCLAGNWRACYFGMRADAKARKLANEFPRSYQHSFICEACMAQKPHKNWEPLMNYKNFYGSAAYRLAPIGSLSIFKIFFVTLSDWGWLVAASTFACLTKPNDLAAQIRYGRLLGFYPASFTMEVRGRLAPGQQLSRSNACALPRHPQGFVCQCVGLLAPTRVLRSWHYAG